MIIIFFKRHDKNWCPVDAFASTPPWHWRAIQTQVEIVLTTESHFVRKYVKFTWAVEFFKKKFVLTVNYFFMCVLRYSSLMCNINKKNLWPIVFPFAEIITFANSPFEESQSDHNLKWRCFWFMLRIGPKKT